MALGYCSFHLLHRRSSRGPRRRILGWLFRKVITLLFAFHLLSQRNNRIIRTVLRCFNNELVHTLLDGLLLFSTGVPQDIYFRVPREKLIWYQFLIHFEINVYFMRTNIINPWCFCLLNSLRFLAFLIKQDESRIPPYLDNEMPEYLFESELSKIVTFGQQGVRIFFTLKQKMTMLGRLTHSEHLTTKLHF